jgi:hypothetical protein
MDGLISANCTPDGLTADNVPDTYEPPLICVVVSAMGPSYINDPTTVLLDAVAVVNLPPDAPVSPSDLPTSPGIEILDFAVENVLVTAPI